MIRPLAVLLSLTAIFAVTAVAQTPLLKRNQGNTPIAGMLR